MDDLTALSRIDSFPYAHRLREVMSTGLLTCDPGMDVGGAVAKMHEARVSSIIALDDEGRAAGIFTERDLLRLLATDGPAALETNLGAVMASPVATVDADAFIYLALAKMSKFGFRHLVVVDGDKRPIGVTTARSLLRVRAADALALGVSIEEAQGSEDMKQVMAGLPRLAKSLLAEGLSARVIASVIAMTVRDLTARAAQLSEQSLIADGWGPAPCRYAVLILGSAGRGESLLTFDQDNAIVYEGGEGEDRWFAELGKRLNDMLNGAGIPFCDGGVMAREAKWRKSLEDWKAEVHSWVFSLDPQTVMYCDIFFDFQPVWGDRALAEELREYSIDKASQSAFFLQYLAQHVAQMETAVGLFGQFKTKLGRLNAKKFGLLPLIAAARFRAIRAHITATATDERYAELRSQGLLHDDDLRDFVEIRELMFRAMLEQQISDIAGRIPPSARIDPSGFDKRTRSRLRWAFHRLHALKYVCGVGR